MTLSECAFNIHARGLVSYSGSGPRTGAVTSSADTCAHAVHAYTMISSRDCLPSYVILLHRFARSDGQRRRGVLCMVAGGF